MYQQKQYSLTLSLLLVLAFSKQSFAQTSGIDIGYVMGNNVYSTVQVRYYRECSTVAMPSNISVSVVNSNGQVITVLTAIQEGQLKKTVGFCPQAVNCSSPASTVKEFQDYQANYFIPYNINSQEITFATSACCVSNAVNNIVSASATMYAECKFVQRRGWNSERNASPLFLSNVNLLAQQGTNSTFQLPVFDLEGDSLHYTVIPSMSSATQSNTYVSPYSASAPLSNNGLLLDPGTGTFTVASTVPTGEYLLNFQCNEYRNGQLIGTSQFARQIRVAAFSLANGSPKTNPVDYFLALTPNGFQADSSRFFVKRLSSEGSQENCYSLNTCPSDSLSFWIPLEVSGANFPIVTPQYYNLSLTPTFTTNIIPGATPNSAYLNIRIPRQAPYNIYPIPRFGVLLETGECPKQGTQLLEFYIDVKRNRNYFDNITATVSEICAGTNNNITLTAPLTSPLSSYLWSPSSGFTNNTLPSVVTNVRQPTIFMVTVSNLAGFCNRFQDTLIIGGINNNSLNITPNVTCAGSPTLFRATQSTLNGTYQWYPTSIFGTQSGPTAWGAPPNGTMVSVTYTDFNGCSISSSMQVTVESLNVSFTGGQTTFYEGQRTSLEVSTGGNTFYWHTPRYFGSGYRNFGVDSSGVYSVTVTSQGGCTQAISTSVTYLPAIQATTASVCSVYPTTLTATGGQQWSWSNGSTDQSIVVTAPGTYTLTTIYGNFLYGEATRTFTQTTVTPQAPITGPPWNSMYCAGQIVTLGTTATASYNWAGPGIAGSPNQQNVTISAVGGYNQYFLTATDSRGCISVGSYYLDISTGVANVSLDSVSIYQGQSVTISGGMRPGGIRSWSGPNNFTSTSSSINVSVAGVYTYTLAGVGTCFEVAQTTVTVIPTYNISHPPCGGYPVTVTALYGGSWRWSGGATTTNVVINSGTSTNLTTTLSNGLRVVTNVNTTPLPVTVTSISGPLNTFCSPQVVMLSCNSPNQCTWSGPDIMSTGQNTALVFPQSTAVYTVSTSLSAVCIATATHTVNIGPALNVPVNVTPSSCPGGFARLQALMTGDRLSTNTTRDCNLYGVEVVQSVPITSPTATTLTLQDNELSGLIPVGFTFQYFCTTFNMVYIASNGYLIFRNAPTFNSALAMPGTTVGQLDRVISAVMADLNPAAGGTISYFTNGNSPNRVFVVDYNDVPLASNNSIRYSFQIRIYETTEEIQIDNINVPNDGTLKTQGIQGTSTYFVAPNRNGTTFSAVGDAVRFFRYPRYSNNTFGFTYSWGAPLGTTATQASQVVYPEETTTYTVTATNTSTGCVVTGSATINIPNGAVSVSHSSITVCEDELFSITATGADNYTWQLDNQPISIGAVFTGSVSGTSSSFTNQPSILRLLATNATGCNEIRTISITVLKPVIEANPNIVCRQMPVEMVTTGNAIAWLWSNNTTGSSAFFAQSGNYSVTMTFASGQRLVKNFTVPNYVRLSVTALSFESYCPVSETRINASFAGGPDPSGASYRFIWNNGSTQQSLFNIRTAGTYTVTITDTRGCTASSSVSFTPRQVGVSITSTNNTICPGSSTTLRALALGDSIISTSNCLVYELESIQYAPLTSTNSTTLNIANGGVSGRISLPFPFEGFCNSISGVYVYANGFISPTSNVPVLTTLIPTITGTFFAGYFSAGILRPANGGRISYFTYGTAPNRKFVVDYSNIATTFGVNISFQIHLEEGTNHVEVHSGNNLSTGLASQGIQGVSVLPSNSGYCTVPGRNHNYFSTNYDAYRFRYGPISRSALNISYVWNNQATLSFPQKFQTEARPTQTTTYTVTASHPGGCISTGSITVNIGNINAGFPSRNVTVTHGGNVSLTANTAYNVTWMAPDGTMSTGATYQGAFPLNVLQTQLYRLTITNNAGCTGFDSIYVSPVGNLVETTGGNTCGVTNVHARAGASWLWSNGATTQATTYLSYGWRRESVTVTDINNFTASETFTPEQGTIYSLSSNNSGYCGQRDTLRVFPVANSSAQIRWSSGQTTNAIGVPGPGTYSVTVTESNCTWTDSIMLRQMTASNPQLQTTDVSCSGTLGSATLTNVEPTSNVYWFTGANYSNARFIDNIYPGIYSLLVEDTSGCRTYLNFNIQGPLNFGLDSSPTECGVSNGSITVTSTITNPLVLWSNGAVGIVNSGLGRGVYSVTVIDNTNGCQLSRSGIQVFHATPCSATVTGTVYNDDASPDCQIDNSTRPIANVLVALKDSLGVVKAYGYTDSTGRYLLRVDTTGAYTIEAMPWGSSWRPLCSSGRYGFYIRPSVIASGVVHDMYFEYSASNDASVQLSSPVLRPGFDATFCACVYNGGGITATGSLTMSYDAALGNPISAVWSSAPSQINTTDRTITWNYSNIAPYTNRCYGVVLSLSASTPIGSQVLANAFITPISLDNIPANDSICDTITVRGSYDPNAKRVYPEGFGANHLIDVNQEKLVYILEFENTGNSPAINVLLRDVIDTTLLDITTAKPFFASHTYKMSISSTNVLEFLFENINLPWTAQNPQLSKGFVAFEIHLKPNLSLGTRINNSVDIFFDFNLPIRTNTAFVTLGNQPGVISTTDERVVSEIMPNPAQNNAILRYTLSETTSLQINIYNQLGRPVANTISTYNQTQGDYSIPISMEHLPGGVYLIVIQTPDENLVHRIVLQR